MVRYLSYRLGAVVPVLLVASVISFSLARLAPGDITLVLLGPYAGEADREQLRQQLALDGPMYVQYARWPLRALSGHPGMSIQMRAPVLQILLEKFGNSLLLGSASFVLAFGGGVAA